MTDVAQVVDGPDQPGALCLAWAPAPAARDKNAGNGETFRR